MKNTLGNSASGFALVLALWALLLLSLFGLTLIRESRATRAQSDAAIAITQARLIADGAINRALLSVLDSYDPVHWSLAGTPQSITLNGERIDVAVESESGKFDLNAIPMTDLITLFTGQGIAAADAEAIAKYVVAWRTRPDPHGDDPDADYQNAGLPYSPRMAPFRSVGELRLVLGMTDTLQAALAPVLTVYSGNPSIDRGVATEAVLRLMAGAGDTLAEAQRVARATGRATGEERSVSSGEVVTIIARFTGKNVALQRRAVIRIGHDWRDPYRVLEWE